MLQNISAIFKILSKLPKCLTHSVQSELLASHITRQASKRSVPLISFVEVSFKSQSFLP